MKIKANQSLYKNILIAFAFLIVFMGSLGYFLGFAITIESFFFYILFLASTSVVFLVTFWVIDKSNHKYIIFDDEKIIEKNRENETIIVYYNQILYTKYHNNIDLIYGIIDFGYVEIVYLTESMDKEKKFVHLYVSKKNYKRIFVNKLNNK